MEPPGRPVCKSRRIKKCARTLHVCATEARPAADVPTPGAGGTGRGHAMIWPEPVVGQSLARWGEAPATRCNVDPM
jgi:hypothetical protein